KRIAINGPRQPDSLPLPRRQRHPALPDLGRITLGQAQNDVMHAGDLRGPEHRLRRGALVEARDVLGNGAVEQGDILRQIADVAAELLAPPLIDRSAIESDRAVLGRPYSDQRLGERSLARRAGAE